MDWTIDHGATPAPLNRKYMATWNLTLLTLTTNIAGTSAVNVLFYCISSCGSLCRSQPYEQQTYQLSQPLLAKQMLYSIQRRSIIDVYVFVWTNTHTLGTLCRQIKSPAKRSQRETRKNEKQATIKVGMKQGKITIGPLLLQSHQVKLIWITLYNCKGYHNVSALKQWEKVTEGLQIWE